MNIKEIKELPDKSPINFVTGVIEKQYPPKDQSENDLKFGQHQQSLLLSNASGDKLMVTLMKSQLHILDPIEGRPLTLSAGVSEDGSLRGLMLNTWQNPKNKYPSIVLKVYPEATMRLYGGVVEPSPAQESEVATQPKEVATQPITAFEKELVLSSYGYCLCLDKASEVIADRPELKEDPTNQRAIATNFWMTIKHHLHTLTPPARTTKAVVKAPPVAKKEMSDDVLIKRTMAGYEKAVERYLSPAAQDMLDQFTEIMDDRELWNDAYSILQENFYNTVFRDDPEPFFKYPAFKVVYDETYAAMGDEITVAKFFVCSPETWRSSMKEEMESKKS
jgi:hypothetical protein